MAVPDSARRRLLAGMALGTGASVLGGFEGAAFAQASPQSARGEYSADFVVVGAGFAGLNCARQLVAKGYSVKVVEARDRVGGRVVNQSIPGHPESVVEGGGEFIGPTQDKIAALAQQVGVDTFATYTQGKTVNYYNGHLSQYGGRFPFRVLLGAIESGEVILRLNRLAKKVPLEAPYKARHAARWDAQSFQGWMDRNVFTPGGQYLLTLAIQSVFSVEPRDLSLLHVLFYIHSAGDLNRLVDTEGGAQQDRFVGGSQLVAEKVAQALGDRVLLNSPVREIAQDDNGVTVSGDDFAVQGRRVVVAMAPTLTSRIRYTPELPGLRDQLCQHVPMASIWKVHAVYPTPFWRAQGLNGQVTSDSGIVRATFDNSPPGGTPGVLMGFIDGSEARRATRMTADDRRAAVLDSLARYFGDPAASPTGYLEQNWQAEPYSRGGPIGYFPPGVWTGFGQTLREPFGRVHWAGTETSEVWSGYMDGAVRSGQRAAEEVIAAGSTAAQSG